LKILLINIKELIQIREDSERLVAGERMSGLPTLKNAYLLTDGNLISAFGPMEELPMEFLSDKSTDQIDCRGRMVLPAWCDPHTHVIFPASRDAEFVDKIRGLSYEEIARRGGGILNSARLMKVSSEEELCISAKARIEEMMHLGTGAIEIKSGYGLDIENELKMLRVIKRLKESMQVTIRSTFLGAHAVPAQFSGNQNGYVDLVVNEMLPRVAEEGLADFIDVFCDRGFFTPDETTRILEAGARFGLRGKIHANELGHTGGVKVAVDKDCLSVDHLEYLDDDEIGMLKGTATMPTILPGAAFFLGLPLSPARKMMEAGLPVALATDFNPGSSPSGNMNFILSLACIRYKMMPEEAINAITINSAYAMGLEQQFGSITVGKVANLIVTKPIDHYNQLPYFYGSNLMDKVILNGELISEFTSLSSGR
jgi:imidazolonepropionase